MDEERGDAVFAYSFSSGAGGGLGDVLLAEAVECLQSAVCIPILPESPAAGWRIRQPLPPGRGAVSGPDQTREGRRRRWMSHRAAWT